MNIRHIRNDQDYEASLRRIEELWGAADGTPEGDELDILIDLVEKYENEHHPVPLPSHIEFIKFLIECKTLK